MDSETAKRQIMQAVQQEAQIANVRTLIEVRVATV
jgi:hypothetical protein